MSSERTASAPPTVIGVLGGIASGKSRVARLLAGSGGLVLDADRLAREALESPSVVQRVRAELGPAALDAEGRPDRTAIGRMVFSSPQLKQRLEGWIHPQVREKIRDGLRRARATGRNPVVLDVPLLLENGREHGLAGLCSFLVFVAADADLRDRRAVESRGWEPGEVARREKTQMPLDQKQARARYVIRNEAGLDELESAVAGIRRAESLE